MQWLLLASLLAVSYASNTTTDPAFQELEAWVIQSGGQIRTYIGTNEKGIRALFVKEPIKATEEMFKLGSSLVINVGSQQGNFLTPPLMLLRELLLPSSRFQPYLNIMPDKDNVHSGCNLLPSLLPLLESKYWTDFVGSWQSYLEGSLKGQFNHEQEYTIREVLGDANVTLSDLKYACALAGTRYIAPGTRNRLLMIPIFDMANHKRGCPHKLGVEEQTGVFRLVAGHDVKAGEEVCFDYGELRDDYALIAYGFLPEVETPPRLLLIDHHNFNASQIHQEKDIEEAFTSDKPEELKTELQRLTHIHEFLLEQDELAALEKSRPAPGLSYITDALLELQKRRRVAIKYEMKRIQNLLGTHEEL